MALVGVYLWKAKAIEKKRKVKLVKDRKRPRSEDAVTLEKGGSEVSSELTTSVPGSSPIRSPSPVPAVRKLKMPKPKKTSAIGDKILTVGQSSVSAGRTVIDLEGQYPEDADLVSANLQNWVDGLVKSASTLTSFLNDGVSKFNETNQIRRQLEEEKAHLSGELSAATLEASEAKKKEKIAVAEAEAARKEVALLKAKLDAAEAEAVARQGPILRAYTERLFLSEFFSGLCGDVADVMTARAVAETVDAVAEDFPDLDKARYGHKEVSVEELNRSFAEIVHKSLKAVPLLESLAKSTNLLTAEAVRDSSVDRDPDMDAIIAELNATPRRTEDEGGAGGDAEVEAEAPENEAQNEEEVS